MYLIISRKPKRPVLTQLLIQGDMQYMICRRIHAMNANNIYAHTPPPSTILDLPPRGQSIGPTQ